VCVEALARVVEREAEAPVPAPEPEPSRRTRPAHSLSPLPSPSPAGPRYVLAFEPPPRRTDDRLL
jgi:hypothetical protein